MKAINSPVTSAAKQRPNIAYVTVTVTLVKSKRMEEHESEPPTPLDLVSFLPHACAQLQASFEIQVIPITESQPAVKKGGSRRSSSNVPTSSQLVSAVSCPWTPCDVNIIAVENLLGHVVELVFWRCKQIPSLLLKIISLCIPFHLYLNKITVRWGPSRGFALKEIAKFLPQSYLTEIRLDDSPMPQRNVHILLEAATSLRLLSLARCGVDDETCGVIADKLRYPLPAAQTLLALSLNSNFISDAGAAAVSAALRSNRALLHLDLADNNVSAAGAADIFRTLMEFPLSDEEVLTRNKRRLEYLKLRNELYPQRHKEPPKTLSKIEERSTAASRRSTRKLSPEANKENVVPIRSRQRVASKAMLSTSVSSWQSASPEGTLSSLTVPSSWPGTPDAAAAAAAAERKAHLLQLKRDPLSKYKTFVRNEVVFSFGNTRLASLNLSYNQLDCASVALLQRVLERQAGWRECSQDAAAAGLRRVHLDGNPIPDSCEALREVQALLERVLSVKEEKPQRRKPAAKHVKH